MWVLPHILQLVQKLKYANTAKKTYAFLINIHSQAEIGKKNDRVGSPSLHPPILPKIKVCRLGEKNLLIFNKYPRWSRKCKKIIIYPVGSPPHIPVPPKNKLFKLGEKNLLLFSKSLSLKTLKLKMKKIYHIDFSNKLI